MKIVERSYSSKIFRPKPLIFSQSDGSLIVVVTPWGQPEHAQKVMDEIVNYVSATSGDVEVTSPFEFLTCLSDDANYLRTSLLIANDQLYRSENKNEYLSGVEAVVLMKNKQKVSWAQIGSPHILIKKTNMSLTPYAIDFDLSFDLTKNNNLLAPLPGKLLGIDRSCQISCGDINVDDGDQLLLLSSSLLPAALWVACSDGVDLDKVTKAMVSEQAEMPFWAGLISF